MGRLETIKRVGFPEEVCPKCWGDLCELCNETGRFKQRLRPDYKSPELQPGQKLLAVLDFDHWEFCGIVDSDGEAVEEINFPFATEYATPDHFKVIGFKTQTT